jgi:hypothetical protein
MSVSEDEGRTYKNLNSCLIGWGSANIISCMFSFSTGLVNNICVSWSCAWSLERAGELGRWLGFRRIVVLDRGSNGRKRQVEAYRFGSFSGNLEQLTNGNIIRRTNNPPRCNLYHLSYQSSCKAQRPPNPLNV